MPIEFKESSRIWFDYHDLHQDTEQLCMAMQKIHPGPAVLIAIGRGGWMPARLLAARYAQQNLPTQAMSVQANYVNIGHPDEYVQITQGLDPIAVARLIQAVNHEGYSPWIIDGPYAVGKTAQLAQHHIAQITEGIVASIAVLHWIRFQQAPQTPWRVNATKTPDAYARKIECELKPYIEYPWEHADLEKYLANKRVN